MKNSQMLEDSSLLMGLEKIAERVRLPMKRVKLYRSLLQYNKGFPTDTLN